MSERINFDTSAVASISVEDLHKIKQNVYALVHLVEKRNLIEVFILYFDINTMWYSQLYSVWNTWLSSKSHIVF